MMGAWLVASSAWAAEPWKHPRTPVINPSELGLSGLSAKDCGACHTEIYEEWSSSVHAAAWWDPQFQAELNKDPEVGWLCLNCHTPVANQQEQLVLSTEIRSPDSVANPSFDAQLRSEGVTCLSCHWTPDGVASVHPDAQAPHKLSYTPSLREDALCNGCHQAQARLEDALVCDFNTAGEKAAAGIEQSCSDCHMPAVSRPVVHGGIARLGGRHNWPGSGIGKSSKSAVPGLNGVDVAFGGVTPDDAGHSIVSVDLTNARAGHMVPSGDPERFLRVVVSALDESGVETGRTDFRIGQTWVWSPVAKKTGDNRLKPGEVRRLDWTMPGSVDAAKIRVVVEHIRLTKSNLDYHVALVKNGAAGPTMAELLDYPRGRVVFEGTFPAKAITP